MPASIGTFELARVTDYMDKVPNHWKKRKGIILPMWQKEALWMNFVTPLYEKEMDTTYALKIGIGKINAISGKQWKNKVLSGQPQNYVPLPKQPWLDGIACGDGFVRQFVAMPLGQGYTVEAQIKGIHYVYI